MKLENELQLIAAAKKNISAYKELYVHYYPKIYRYCRHRLPNKEIAYDVTSRVFLASLEALQRFEVDRGLRLGSLLYRMANNKIYDHYKRNENKYQLKVDVVHEENYDRILEVEEKRKKIHNVLLKLNPRYQDVITMKFFTDLSHEELSEVLGIDKGHVAVLLHRALQAFKKEFQKTYPKSEIYSLANRSTK